MWKRLSITLDHPPHHSLTPLQVRPPFPLLIGIVSHVVLHCVLVVMTQKFFIQFYSTKMNATLIQNINRQK